MFYRYLCGSVARCTICAIAVLVSLCVASPEARADFGEPVRITDGEGGATDCAIAVDGADNVFVISVVSGRVLLDLIGPGLRDRVALPELEGQQSSPVLASNCCGRTFIAFSQSPPDTTETGREIVMGDNNGGAFSSFNNVSLNDVDDELPTVELDINGLPQLAWIRVNTDEPKRVVHFDLTTSRRTEVADGDLADIGLNDDDPDRIAHILYRSGPDLFYINNSTGSFENPVAVTNTPTQDEENPNIAVNERGDLFITYEAEGSLLFVSKPVDGEFSPPRFLDSNVSQSRLTIRNGSLLSISYEKEGGVFFIQGLSTFLLEAEAIGESEASRSSPRITADSKGNLHACYIEEGEVIYTNNAGSVQAEFSAEPRVGEAPLTVNFQDLSSGDVAIWRWEFGDDPDSQATVQNPEFTFDDPGEYTVTLTVFSADKESTVVKEDFIIVQESQNTLAVPNQAVVPNQQEVWFPVFATHPDPIRGFQIHLNHDPNILEYVDCTTENSVTRAAAPEFLQCNNFPEEGRQEIGVLLEFEPPFEGLTIPPGERQTLLNIVYNVSAGAPEGAVTELRLVNDSAISRIFNIFTVGSQSKYPKLESARIEIIPVTPPNPIPTFFIRGDVDGNRAIEITDSVKLLNFLFIGGTPPACDDAADFNDRGSVDISGAIAILNFLFLGGISPMPPFPNLGIDPSEDDLAPCD